MIELALFVGNIRRSENCKTLSAQHKQCEKERNGFVPVEKNNYYHKPLSPWRNSVILLHILSFFFVSKYRVL